MRKMTLLCSLLVFSVLTGYSKDGGATSNEEEKYSINSDGDAYFSKELSTTLSFPEVCTKVTEIISSNFVNAGAGIALNNQENLFMANYIFPSVQRAFPLVLDAWCILKVELKDEKVYFSLTLTNYSKHTSSMQQFIKISDTQPLNPKGKKHGFGSQKQLIDAFNDTCIKATALIQKIEQSIENQ